MNSFSVAENPSLMNGGIPPTPSFLGRFTARILRAFRNELEKPEETIAHAVEEAFEGLAREFRN